MSTIQRRMALLLGAIAATMAVSVAPALADNVDFPHETASAEWDKVEAFDYNGSLENAEACGSGGADCSFEDTTEIKLYRELFGFKFSADHECSIEGEIVSLDGDLEVSDSGCYEPLSTVGANGEICQHRFTGEIWVRLPISTGEGNEMFAHLVLEPSGVKGPTVPTFFAQGMAFGDPDDDVYTSFNYTGSGNYNQSYISADYDAMWGSQQVLIGGSVSEDGCGWPELS